MWFHCSNIQICACIKKSKKKKKLLLKQQIYVCQIISIKRVNLNLLLENYFYKQKLNNSAGNKHRENDATEKISKFEEIIYVNGILFYKIEQANQKLNKETKKRANREIL